MNDDFTIHAAAIKNEYLLQTEALFSARKDEWFAPFVAHIQEMCTQIQRLQTDSFLPALSYIEYSMLFTHIINRRYVADVMVYGNRSYLDKGQRYIGQYDISSLFVYFDKLWEELIELKKRYTGLVSARDVITFMFCSLPDFYSYLTNIARFAIRECGGRNIFESIIKNEEFAVNVGDYMATTETVYAEKKTKNAKRLADWFAEKLVGKYIFGDYTGLDFSGQSFVFTDLRYARFNGSILRHTKFYDSSLIGTDFRGCDMYGCRLDNCFIYEADFSGANLNGAILTNTRAKAGLTDKENWKFVGFLPTNFRNTNLTNADFTGANLTGADFSGAVLSGADLNGANLTGADFTGANLTRADFTGANLSGADFADAILTDAIFTDMIITQSK